MGLASTLFLSLALVGALSSVLEPRLATLPCGTHTMMPANRVAIQTPNYPSNYNNDYRCQYEITCNPMNSTHLAYICPVFQLESSPGCVADHLIVTSRGSRLVKCGTNSPDGIVTTDGWTRLTFFSNGQKPAKGFRCYVWCHESTNTTSTNTTSGRLF